MLYIGVDLGTSAVKLLLMDGSGRIHKVVSREYPLYFPHPAWSEQNPEDWWEQTCAGVRALLEGFDPGQVDGISFGGQMHGLVALDENERFRNILGFAEKHSDFVMETARIVSWSADNWGSSFTISKGLRNGIEVGDCVVNEYGALVGQISELGESSAVVRTLIDVDTSIGALVGADGSAAMLMGDYTLMRQGQVKVTWLTEGAQLFLEDDVLTSGSGGLIPQGIVIGSVASIQSEAGGQTEYGIIQPAVDLDTLVQVFIIKEFDVTE